MTTNDGKARIMLHQPSCNYRSPKSWLKRLHENVANCIQRRRKKEGCNPVKSEEENVLVRGAVVANNGEFRILTCFLRLVAEMRRIWLCPLASVLM